MSNSNQVKYKIVFEKLDEALSVDDFGASIAELQRHIREISELGEALGEQDKLGKVYTST